MYKRQYVHISKNICTQIALHVCIHTYVFRKLNYLLLYAIFRVLVVSDSPNYKEIRETVQSEVAAVFDELL